MSTIVVPPPLEWPERTKIVALIGSSRFRQMFEEVERVFTLDGLIVLSPGVYPNGGDQVTAEQHRALENLQCSKIALSDWVFVVDPGGYIGKSTLKEIRFAESIYKPIRYLEPIAEPRLFLPQPAAVVAARKRAKAVLKTLPGWRGR